MEEQASAIQGAYFYSKNSRKNEKRNKDIININELYVINSNLIIRGNRIIKNTKKYKKKITIIRISIIALSETDNDEEVIIEIKNNIECFKKGDNQIINVNLLEITTENIWNNLL